MIEVKNITKKFGAKTAIENISFKVENGSVYGLVGFNGAGKTTLIKCIAGVYKPDKGQAFIDGKDTFADSGVRQKMFYAADEFAFPNYSSLLNAAKYFAGYFPKFDFDTLDKLCEVFGLDKNAKISSFSKGMRCQAMMVIAMSAKPEVLLLDEAFDGLDPAVRSKMNNMLLDYAAQTECSVLISSHNLHEISDICDKVALINGQKIALECSVDEAGAGRCKFRLAFEDEKTQADFSGFDIIRFKGDGRMITLSLRGDEAENEAKLREMNPILLEKFPLTLEEVFLEEMEGSDYDFTEIFS
ncbi:MAG: ABC transporter ATP-binding protein [Clostridia bacterium]|nr:ABC transporter ATP-binding protein [Clostridia bacterium]MBR6360817.1 ABC transporter ATP-binding protein [Clostridia bacterium]